MEGVFTFIVLQCGQLWVTFALMALMLVVVMLAWWFWARQVDPLWNWPIGCWVTGLLLGDFLIGPAVADHKLYLMRDHNPALYFHANAVWGYVLAVIGLIVGLYIGYRKTEKHARARA